MVIALRGQVLKPDSIKQTVPLSKLNILKKKKTVKKCVCAKS
jgi:hypothetical protein